MQRSWVMPCKMIHSLHMLFVTGGAMEIVCPFCEKAKDLQRGYLGLVNVPCECGAVGVINKADSLHLMKRELAGIFDVPEISDKEFDTHAPVEIDMEADAVSLVVPMMIQWARRKCTTV